MVNFYMFIGYIIWTLVTIFCTALMFKYLSRPNPPVAFLSKPYAWLNNGTPLSTVVKVFLSYFISTICFVLIIAFYIFICSFGGRDDDDYYYD